MSTFTRIIVDIDSRAALIENAKKILDKATAEKRDLTAEEDAEFNRLHLEANKKRDEANALIAAHKRDLVEHLAQLAARGHSNSPSWFPAALAVIVDGAIVQCTIFASTDPLDAARSAVHRLLETIPT